MKVAIFSESENDELALRILTEAILGLKTQTVSFPPQARGWPAVRDGLPAVLRFLHYRTDAEALIVVTDADDSPLHQPSHEQSGQATRNCRYCDLIETARPIQQPLKALPERSPLKLAIGIAVPAIEAWYLCGLDSRASEASWLQGGTATRGSDLRRELKRRIYSNHLRSPKPTSCANRHTDWHRIYPYLRGTSPLALAHLFVRSRTGNSFKRPLENICIDVTLLKQWR